MPSLEITTTKGNNEMERQIKLTDDQASKILKKLEEFNPREKLNERLFEVFRQDLKKPKLIVIDGGKK